jgi:hypothetical protein
MWIMESYISMTLKISHAAEGEPPATLRFRKTEMIGKRTRNKINPR